MLDILLHVLLLPGSTAMMRGYQATYSDNPCDFFCSKSGRLTQNQEKHSTVDENIRGWPKEKKSATLKLQSQLMGNTCTVYTDGLMTSDLTPLVSRRVIGCEGSEGKGFHLLKTGSQNTIKTNLV